MTVLDRWCPWQACGAPWQAFVVSHAWQVVPLIGTPWQSCGVLLWSWQAFGSAPTAAPARPCMCPPERHVHVVPFEALTSPWHCPDWCPWQACGAPARPFLRPLTGLWCPWYLSRWCPLQASPKGGSWPPWPLPWIRPWSKLIPHWPAYVMTPKYDVTDLTYDVVRVTAPDCLALWALNIQARLGRHVIWSWNARGTRWWRFHVASLHSFPIIGLRSWNIADFAKMWPLTVITRSIVDQRSKIWIPSWSTRRDAHARFSPSSTTFRFDTPGWSQRPPACTSGPEQFVNFWQFAVQSCPRADSLAKFGQTVRPATPVKHLFSGSSVVSLTHLKSFFLGGVDHIKILYTYKMYMYNVYKMYIRAKLCWQQTPIPDGIFF